MKNITAITQVQLIELCGHPTTQRKSELSEVYWIQKIEAAIWIICFPKPQAVLKLAILPKLGIYLIDFFFSFCPEWIMTVFICVSIPTQSQKQEVGDSTPGWLQLMGLQYAKHLVRFKEWAEIQIVCFIFRSFLIQFSRPSFR